MAEKWPQRDAAGSRAFLLEADRTYRLNTRGDFPYPEQHLRIDNTKLEPEVVAHRIVEHFRLPRIGSLSLRQAAAADAGAIHELHLKSVRGLCASSYAPDVIEGWLKGRTAAGYLPGIERGATFVAEAASVTVGFCEAIPGEVVGVFVDPQWTGRGVGTTLVSLALDIAARDARLVRLESTLNAVQFYTRFGFKQIARSTVRRNDVDIPVVVMQKPAA